MTKPHALTDDEAMLTAILDAKPRSVEAFQAIVNDFPRHEIVRYLDKLVTERLPPDATGPRGFFLKLRAFLRPPLKAETRMLQAFVRDQRDLLAQFMDASDGLWALLRELHETIRIGEEPNRALSLYRSISARSGSSAV